MAIARGRVRRRQGVVEPSPKLVMTAVALGLLFGAALAPDDRPAGVAAPDVNVVAPTAPAPDVHAGRASSEP